MRSGANPAHPKASCDRPIPVSSDATRKRNGLVPPLRHRFHQKRAATKCNANGRSAACKKVRIMERGLKASLARALDRFPTRCSTASSNPLWKRRPIILHLFSLASARISALQFAGAYACSTAISIGMSCVESPIAVAAAAEHPDPRPPEFRGRVREHRRAHEPGRIGAAPARCRTGGIGCRQS